MAFSSSILPNTAGFLSALITNASLVVLGGGFRPCGLEKCSAKQHLTLQPRSILDRDPKEDTEPHTFPALTTECVSITQNFQNKNAKT